MGFGAGGQQRFDPRQLLGIALGGKAAAQQFEAQVDEIGIEDIGLAVLADTDDFTGEKCVPDLGAGEPEFPGSPSSAATSTNGARARPWKPARMSIRSMCRQ